ncbi:hypothetical protein MJO28_002868 [Puccinia striiformis f. sp. tritici]|uniref:Secreted protein n=3 Tax=Puccinia striiformis TaxID=27350 RepID=A0A0L0VK74_9BASI|nr:hypothetical protein Pst134EA_005185 [Puccinia striiformis f. sp. tritici]KAI9629070.1 hypothetical protein H4Q26_018329 [Puccinia striiformis f. sp. tritici PST-130]KNE99673.1 hypothetical protein PSTG_07166 [Puccinia striiformis f. sp. tritici PST-78]POW20309.1 hypothetical protein PSHT_03644 [Puccinia striiformis]KAH9462347.1 hypothetical protein Pst134EB_006249 [Puccinia striiformis f. sp. tritici]KAH9471278.1 hypothetical protein Pst134EA_005185 [Puccinia striiformis f. sp. tritici]
MQILISLIMVAFVLEAAFGTPVGPLTARYEEDPGFPQPNKPSGPIRRGLEDQNPHGLADIHHLARRVNEEEY